MTSGSGQVRDCMRSRPVLATSRLPIPCCRATESMLIRFDEYTDGFASTANPCAEASRAAQVENNPLTFHRQALENYRLS